MPFAAAASGPPRIVEIECAVALHFMHCSFAGIHQSLGVTDTLCEIEDIAR